MSDRIESFSKVQRKDADKRRYCERGADGVKQ